jgi:hypothetical protein
MSRTFFSLDRKEKVFPLPSSPVRKGRGWDVPRILCSSISVASLLRSDDVDRFLKLASRGGCLVAVGSEEARCRASLRPPLKLYVPISGIQLSRRRS